MARLPASNNTAIPDQPEMMATFLLFISSYLDHFFPLAPLLALLLRKRPVRCPHYSLKLAWNLFKITRQQLRGFPMVDFQN
jgi:hypothetical protein